jgi:predicted permease
VKTSPESLGLAVQDVRYAVRSLRRQPSFALTVILTLALGIGATTTIYTLFDALVVRPLPVPHPERLAIIGDPAKIGWNWFGPPKTDYVSFPLYKDVRDGSHVLSGLYASGALAVDLVAPGADTATAEHPTARAVSGSFFSVLELRAFAGRMFTGDDDRAGADPVAVLSSAYWQRRLGGQRSVVGSTLRLSGVPVTVVGIGPPSFTGDIVGVSTDLWISMSVVARLPHSQTLLDDRTASWLQMMGRLAPGVTLDRARAEITTVEVNAVRSHLAGQDLIDFNHDLETDPVRVESGARGFSSQRVAYASALGILMAAVSLLALVVCANLANLTLARAMARGRELTVRMALGAARRRLIAQLLTESAVIGVAAAALGLLASTWGTSALLALADSVTFLDVHADARVLGFAAGVTVLSVLLFGLVPAVHATRLDAATTLRAQGRGLVGVRGRLGKSLVAAQIALSTLLLVGAGLLVQSARRLLSADLGVDRDHVIAVNIHLGNTNYAGDRLQQYRQAMERQAMQVPGVLATSYSHNGLLSRGLSLVNIEIPGVVARSDAESSILANRVGAGYVRATGAALLSGRDFDVSDERPGVHHAIINATMARAHFTNRDPIGQLITVDSVVYTVVGVVRDLEERDVRSAPVRSIYLAQAPGEHPGPSFQLIVRTSGAPARSLEPLRNALRSVDAAVPFELEPLTQRLRASVRESLLLTNMTLAFGLVTLLVAALGLYGVTSYATTRRTSEFGLRMALGASSASVTGMVLREALTITVIGIGVGLPVGVGAARLIRSQLFGVSAVDPASLSIAIAMLVLTALLASWVPARRAAAAAPVDALKAD